MRQHYKYAVFQRNTDNEQEHDKGIFARYYVQIWGKNTSCLLSLTLS